MNGSRDNSPRVQKNFIFSGDVTNESFVKKFVGEVCDRYGRIDILVNNTGGRDKIDFLENLDAEIWDRIFNLNLKSAFLILKETIPILKAQKYGKVINIASTAGMSGFYRATPEDIARVVLFFRPLFRTL